MTRRDLVLDGVVNDTICSSPTWSKPYATAARAASVA